MGDDYFLCKLEGLIMAADALDGLELSLQDQFVFTCAPCRIDDVDGKEIFRKFATLYSTGDVCRVQDTFQVPNMNAVNFDELRKLETDHKDIILYLWLR